MTRYTERRNYQRFHGNECKLLLSTDRKRWDYVEVGDISAGGLMFLTKEDFCENEVLYFYLQMYNMLSEFNMSFEGVVLRKEVGSDGIKRYGIKFQDISKYHQVQLDEIIKAKIAVKCNSRPVVEDGLYAFVFIPKARRSSRARLIRRR